MFKSYYVVWKPVGNTVQTDGVFEFKSYYVVWKQFFCNVQKDNV